MLFLLFFIFFNGMHVPCFGMNGNQNIPGNDTKLRRLVFGKFPYKKTDVHRRVEMVAEFSGPFSRPGIEMLMNTENNQMYFLLKVKLKKLDDYENSQKSRSRNNIIHGLKKTNYS